VGGVVVVQLRVRFLTCRPVPGIFAIKVESCQKSCCFRYSGVQPTAYI